MINFFINIKNNYLRVAISELIHEAMSTSPESRYRFFPQWNEISITDATVIFMEMKAGEWYLCHDIFQHVPEHCKLFIFQQDTKNKKNLELKELPNCIKDAVFMDVHSSVYTLKNEISKATRPHLNKKVANKFNRLRSCINCPRKLVSNAQMKVFYAFSIGLTPHEIAAELKISHKTVYSHRKNIMSKFKLDNRQQFNSLAQILTKR